MDLLLIDDNQDITTMFSKYFKLKGHNVFVSNSGQNGLQIIENEKFDAILLDLAMPDFSGKDIVTHLYNNNKINSHTIVALTASSISDDDKIELKSKGVHSVLRKPIDPDELLRYLERIKS
ncbi:response regulator [Candidatus Nitrosotenuis sp. DW1]|uniref:response regulator n=1 Tax=Candidatus Nitrosotenuis sp. DW1 TaxID=2259672 RepID=UPI0015DCEBE7|nr:response regulator [Candidatus Nitrosotenuis sp. DW1]QLH09381.1 response regulator [Candidatus Nitrosotenuis sp. DW1]